MEFSRKLAFFLWSDNKKNAFKNPSVLSLYARACGEDVSRSRLYIEEALFEGIREIKNQNFSYADLAGGRYTGMIFINCDFTGAKIQRTDLENCGFIKCNLLSVILDDSKIEGSYWFACDNIMSLNTEPFLYEKIADLIIVSRGKKRKEKKGHKESKKYKEELFKMYKTIIDLHEDKNTLNKDIKERLIEKGKKVRKTVFPHGYINLTVK